MTKLEEHQKRIRDMEARVKAILAKAEAEGNRDVTAEELAECKAAQAECRILADKIDVLNAAASSRPGGDSQSRIEIVADAADKPFDSFGEYLQAVAAAALPRGSDRIGRFQAGVLDRRLVSRMSPEFRAAASGMNEATPAEGGFLVDKDWSSGLIEKAHETGKLVSMCRKIPIGEGKNGIRAPYLKESSRATGSRLGGVRVYRKNEAGAGVHAAPEFGRFEMDLEDMIGLCYATNDLIQDATALGAIVEQGFAQEFGFKLDDEIVNGTGAGQGLGFLAAPCLTTITKET